MEGDEKLKQEIALERNLLHSLLDHTPDAIYFKDMEGRYLKVSKSLADMIGTDPDHVVGKTDYDFFPEEQAKRMTEEDKKVIQTGVPINYEKKISPKKGEERWISVTKVPHRNNNGEIVGVFGISRDITARKKAEAGMAFERSLLRSLLDHIPDSVYFKDRQGRFLRVSKGKADEVNMTRNEMIGKTDYDFFPKEQADKMREDDERVMRTQKPVIKKLEKISTPSGEDRWVSATKVPRYDEKGRVVGTLGISRDLTEYQLILKRIQDTGGL